MFSRGQSTGPQETYLKISILITFPKHAQTQSYVLSGISASPLCSQPQPLSVYTISSLVPALLQVHSFTIIGTFSLQDTTHRFSLSFKTSLSKIHAEKPDKINMEASSEQCSNYPQTRPFVQLVTSYNMGSSSNFLFETTDHYSTSRNQRSQWAGMYLSSSTVPLQTNLLRGKQKLVPSIHCKISGQRIGLVCRKLTKAVLKLLTFGATGILNALTFYLSRSKQPSIERMKKLARYQRMNDPH